jgi:DNA-directed RNA polymerase specialized sigma24 family protein
MRRRSDSALNSPVASVESRLRGLLISCHVPESEWADCVQEAWLALLMKHSDWPLDGPRTVAWLRTVTCNRAFDLHRRLKRHPSRRLDDLPPDVVRDDSTPGEQEPDGGSPNRRFEGVQRLLGGLADVDREILTRQTASTLT